MKRFLLVWMLISIYLLSSVPYIEVLNPASWLRMEFTYFTVNFHAFTSLHSGFFITYQFDIADKNLVAHKACHFIFFGTLSILILWNIKSSLKHPYIVAWIFTTLYGLLDELHQFTVPGRSGLFQDVLIDSSAAFLWLLVVNIIQQIFFKDKSKRSGSSSLWGGRP